MAFSDTINGIGLLIGGLLVPILALFDIGHGNIITGISNLYHHAPHKFNVIGAPDSVMPFSTLFTGLVINQLYFWCMNQTIIQRALWRQKSSQKPRKACLYTGALKILVPLIIVLPGVIAFYYFGDSMYDNQDMVYPLLIKKVLPLSLVGFFAAVVMGAVLSTFNSVLNSAATIFSVGIYKRHYQQKCGRNRACKNWAGGFIRSGHNGYSGRAVGGQRPCRDSTNSSNNSTAFSLSPSLRWSSQVFSYPKVSAAGAKVALVTGLVFYILTTFVLNINLHFIHVWGIEFVLNILVMLGVSYFYPVKKAFNIQDVGVVNQKPWKFTTPMAIILVIITVSIYIWLGNV